MVVARIARVEKRVEPPAKAVVTPSHRRPLADVSAEIRVQGAEPDGACSKTRPSISSAAPPGSSRSRRVRGDRARVKATSRGPIFYVQDRCGSRRTTISLL